jgi:hypothetical protein
MRSAFDLHEIAKYSAPIDVVTSRQNLSLRRDEEVSDFIDSQQMPSSLGLSF